MVRVLLLSIIVTMSGFFTASGALAFAEAGSESWKQACRSDKGQYSTLKEGENGQSQSELPVCFFGETAVGAESLYNLKSEGQVSEALKAYKKRKSSSPRGGVCGAFDATLVTGKDPAGQSYNLCRFADNSVMEETTLWLGPGNTGSDTLDAVLSKVN